MERDDRTPDRLDADPRAAADAAADTREPPEAARLRDREFERTRAMQDQAEAMDRSAERTVESNENAIERNGRLTGVGAAEAEKLAAAARALGEDVRRTRDAVRAVDPNVDA